VWSGSRDPFCKFWPRLIFGIGQARHFKCRLLIDTSWLYESLLMTFTANLCMWHGALHACCAVFELTRTMHVQNYASSRIKHSNCWKCSSDWHAICMHNSSTSQMVQSDARVSRRQRSFLFYPVILILSWNMPIPSQSILLHHCNYISLPLNSLHVNLSVTSTRYIHLIILI